MTQDTRYNGWANHATWAVHLHLSNDEGTYNYWREAARECREEAPDHENCQPTTRKLPPKRGRINVEEVPPIWTVERCAVYLLADKLKDEIDEGLFGDNGPLAGDGFWTLLARDLLDLCDVNWHEVAEAFLEE